MTLVHVPTTGQVADLFTKGLSKPIFELLSPRLMGEERINTGAVLVALTRLEREASNRVQHRVHMLTATQDGSDTESELDTPLTETVAEFQQQLAIASAPSTSSSASGLMQNGRCEASSTLRAGCLSLEEHPALLKHGINTMLGIERRYQAQLNSERTLLIRELRMRLAMRVLPDTPPPSYTSPERVRFSFPARPDEESKTVIGTTELRAGNRAWSPTKTQAARQRAAGGPDYPDPDSTVAVSGWTGYGKRFHHLTCSSLYCDHGALRGRAFHSGVRITTTSDATESGFTICKVCGPRLRRPRGG